MLAEALSRFNAHMPASKSPSYNAYLYNVREENASKNNCLMQKSNCIPLLRNKKLTLKAKGLLPQMLSLPEDRDYTLAGLSQINRESIDTIRTAVWELEKAGYIKRRQRRLSHKNPGNRHPLLLSS